MLKKTLVSSCTALLLGASALATHAAEPAIYVYSTIDALLAGAYDGDLTVKHLAAKGDFGLGTFNRLNGEMVVLDGTFWHIKADGTVAKADPDERVPLAFVLPFRPSTSFAVKAPGLAMPLARLEALIDGKLANKNVFHAVKVAGDYSNVSTRAIAPQTRPYRPLAEVSKEQVVFDRAAVSGTLVGIRSPAFSKGISVPGWHWHFISDTREFGGHVLAGNLIKGEVALGEVRALDLQLPATDDFVKVDQAKDRAAELHEVERGKR